MGIANALTFRAVAEILGLLLSAVSMIYVSRIVGPEYLGFSATTSALVLLVSRLSDGGLTALSSQRLARDDDDIKSLLAITLPVKFLVSSLMIVLVLAVCQFLPMDWRLKYFIVVSVFLVFFEVCSPAWIFIAMGKINVSSMIRIGQSLIYATAIVVLIRRVEDWIWLPYLTLLNSAVNFTLALCFLIYYKLIGFNRSLFTTAYFKVVANFYKEAAHFLKADLSSYAYTSSDRLILYYFATPHVVGLYEAAYKVINPFYSINTVITPTMFRELAQSFKHGALHRTMARYVFTMSICTIPLGFFLLFFAKDVVQLLYGARFSESAPSLAVLGFVISFGFTSGIIVQPFSAWNLSRAYGSSIFWGNVVNMALNVVLIPFFGALGAAVATLAAKVAVTIVGYLYFRQATAYPICRDFAYFIACSLLALLLAFAVSLVMKSASVQMVVFAVVYLLTLYQSYRVYFKKQVNLDSGSVHAG